MSAKFIIRKSNVFVDYVDYVDYGETFYQWDLISNDEVILSKGKFKSENEARDNIKLIKKSLTKYTKVESE